MLDQLRSNHGSILRIAVLAWVALPLNAYSGSKPKDSLDYLPKVSWQEGVSGPVCGVYATCSAIRRLGGEADPNSFVSAKYIGTCAGTTEDQLISLVHDAGFRGYPANALSTLDLKVAGSPFIAFVRPDATVDRFSHWVTVEPLPGGFLIYDGIKKPYATSEAEFSSTWSGRGVFVAESQSSSPLMTVYFGRLLLIQLGLVLVFLVFVAVRRLRIASDRLRDYALIGAITLVLTALSLVSYIDTEHSRDGVRIALAPHYLDPPEVSLEYMLSRVENDDVMLVDARREVDYRLGSLPGAINIPVYAAPEDMRQFLEGVRKETHFMVFCQSSQCQYDEIVSRRLASLGYENVLVCTSGVYEYSQMDRGGQSDDS